MIEVLIILLDKHFLDTIKTYIVSITQDFYNTKFYMKEYSLCN